MTNRGLVLVRRHTPVSDEKYDIALTAKKDGRHYSSYEATQRQRNLEAAMCLQKRRILVDEATSDTEKLQTDQIILQMLR